LPKERSRHQLLSFPNNTERKEPKEGSFLSINPVNS
jgi:hypothetical protein